MWIRLRAAYHPSAPVAHDPINNVTHLGTGGLVDGFAGIIVNRSGSRGTKTRLLSRFFVMSDRVVLVSGLSFAQKAKVLDAAGTVLAEATEIGGVASVDLLMASFPGPAEVIVTTADDVIIGRLTPPNGVWGGDEYVLTSGGG